MSELAHVLKISLSCNTSSTVNSRNSFAGLHLIQRPPSLHDLCIRTAAIYATTSLYEFHDKHREHQSIGIALNSPALPNSAAAAIQHAAGNVASGSSNIIQESIWEEVFPLLDKHFFQLVPGHLYEQFLDNVLCALEIAGHFDITGKQLMQYIILFFPKGIKRFKAFRYVDRVLLPTVCCLHKCSFIEELYLEKADSSCISTYLLAHVFKHTNRLRVLSLPKQSDDDVVSILSINCPNLESVVLTGTNVTNVGLSWLLCCRKLHTIIMQGFFQGVSPKGVALLLNGLPGLRHVVYDTMSDVLTYVDFNTSESVQPQFGLKTIFFDSMELLSSNHLELVTKLCPNVEWLSLDTALFYNLEGLGSMPTLRLLRLNYKSRSVDQTVVDFFGVNGHFLNTLHLIDIKDLHIEDFYLTVGECVNLENLVLVDCSIIPDFWGRTNFRSQRQQQPISRSVEHLQLVNLDISPNLLVDFLGLFRDLQILEIDRCELDLDQMKLLLLGQPELHTLRCTEWSSPNANSTDLTKLQMEFRSCKLQMSRQSFVFDDYETQRTLAAALLSEYAGFSPLIRFETVVT